MKIDDGPERRDCELPFKDLDFLLPRVECHHDLDLHVVLNEEAHEFVRRLREQVRIRSGRLERGSEDAEPVFDAILLEPNDVRDFSQAFTDVVGEAMQKGYQESEFSHAATVLLHIRKSAQSYWGTAIAYVYPTNLSGLMRKQREISGTVPKLR